MQPSPGSCGYYGFIFSLITINVFNDVIGVDVFSPPLHTSRVLTLFSLISFAVELYSSDAHFPGLIGVNISGALTGQAKCTCALRIFILLGDLLLLVLGGPHRPRKLMAQHAYCRLHFN